MVLDITNLLNNNGASLEIDETGKIEDLDENGIIDFNEPVNFKGIVSNSNGIILVLGRVRTRYTSKCCRCNEIIFRELEQEVKEEVLSESNNSEWENYVYKDDTLKLDEILRDTILLSIPMKQICVPECKGLCPTCGENLNNGKCRCSNDDVEERLILLKDYFRKA